jgi:hypothetical protein
MTCQCWQHFCDMSAAATIQDTIKLMLTLHCLAIYNL